MWFSDSHLQLVCSAESSPFCLVESETQGQTGAMAEVWSLIVSLGVMWSAPLVSAQDSSG